MLVAQRSFAKGPMTAKRELWSTPKRETSARKSGRGGDPKRMLAAARKADGLIQAAPAFPETTTFSMRCGRNGSSGIQRGSSGWPAL
jgi:hypothetical protein